MGNAKKVENFGAAALKKRARNAPRPARHRRDIVAQCRHVFQHSEASRAETGAPSPVSIQTSIGQTSDRPMPYSSTQSATLGPHPAGLHQCGAGLSVGIPGEQAGIQMAARHPAGGIQQVVRPPSGTQKARSSFCSGASASGVERCILPPPAVCPARCRAVR